MRRVEPHPAQRQHVSRPRRWTPTSCGSNGILAIFIAGPAQTFISIAQSGEAPQIAEQTLEGEAGDLEAAKVIGTTSQDMEEPQLLTLEGAKRVLATNVDLMQTYLSQPEVQIVIQSIADFLEVADGASRNCVEWSELRSFVTGRRLPPLPEIVLQ